MTENPSRWTRWRGVPTLAAALLLAVAAGAAGASAPFRADCEALTAGPHRQTAAPEYAQAADYVAARLAALQPEWVVTQRFATVRLRTRDARLVFAEGGRTLPLSPMRPDDLMAPVTPPGGVSGRLLNVGNASREDLAHTDLAGRIAVVDYNSGSDWLRAFRLGARAVIFVRRGPLEARHPHYVEADLNLLRYYYAGDPADLPDGATVTLHAEVAWEPGVGRNQFAFFRGTDPVFSQGKEEVIVLAAHLDSFGEVPDLSPGARGAANVAALLQIGERLAAHRPRRHVLLAVFDGQSLCHLGSSRFYRALEQDDKKATVDARKASFDAERSFLESLADLLARPRPLQTNSPARRQLLNRLTDRGAEHAFAIGKAMYELRAERQELRAREAGGTATDADRARIGEITRAIDERWQPDKDAWNALRRALGRDETAGLDGEVRARLDQILDEVRRNVEGRREELALEGETLAADTTLRDRLGDLWIALHLSLVLGDNTPRWGLVIGGNSPLHSSNDNPGLYGKVQSVFLRAAENLRDEGRPLRLFETASADQTLPQTRVLWAAPALVHSGEVAGLFGIYNLALATDQEDLRREGTPDDTLEALDLDRIEAQAGEIARVLSAVADLDLEAPEQAAAPPGPTGEAGPGPATAGEPPPPVAPDAVEGGPAEVGVANQEALSLRRGIVANKQYVLPEFKGDLVSGPMVMGMLPGSSMPNTPIRGAIVQVVFREPWLLTYDLNKPYAFREYQVLRTTRNGTYGIGPAPGGWFWSVLRGFAAVFDEHGRPRSVSNMETYGSIRSRLNVFECRAAGEPLPPLRGTWRGFANGLRILSARDNGQLDPKKNFRQCFDGVLSWYTDEREKGVKIFGLEVLDGLNSGPLEHREAGDTQIDPLGKGFPMTQPWQPFPASRRSAVDLWRLNDSRLQLLQGKNIIDSSLAELHGRSEDLLLAAQEAGSGVNAEALDASSMMASRPVYYKVRATVDDLVFAVLILLGLSVPFAFALERVIIGATTIYRQIVWFAVFFVATFVILFLSHPAFAIANTPIIIFLGFAILILALLVISIILRKFEVELRALQGMPATVHVADVSRVSTLLAAMQMGISTMRRRPLRTALTAITIVLLTFTILSFASFGTETGIVRIFAAPRPSYSGIWVHDVNWGALGPDLMDIVQGRWGAQADVYPRRWICPQRLTDAGQLVTREDGSRPVIVKGVLGLAPGELRHRPDLERLLGDDLDEAILITHSVARALGVGVGDQVRMGGQALRVARLLDEAAVSAATDMDNTGLLPVDFTEERSSTGNTQSLEDQLVVPINWTSLPVDEVVVVSEATAARMGASFRGISLYPRDPADAAGIADDLARILPLPVAATLDNGVYRHVLGTVVAASGAADLVFPILLGGLVIFGTMLGSVADREREIYTFSALGLAPRHVATLFLAESVVYSVIGGMGGYLLAQGLVRILHALASHGLVRVPEMNMSSTNTIVTILIVMGTVLVSAIYPAVKASRSANPGLMRTWRPPEPEGDVLDMVFPFTVSEYDITGVVSFLKEHFDSHSDTGLGRFMSANARLVREPDGVLGLRAFLTLAPFDLGVSQAFLLRSTPSEIRGIDEVRIRLERRSGQPKDWKRLNRVLLDDLRRQFLIWRSLSQDVMEVYRHQTFQALGRAGGAHRQGGVPGEDGHDG